MTRNEFFEEITTFSDLINFCWENSLSSCDDIYDAQGVSERVEGCLEELVSEHAWRTVRAILNSVPENDYYYYVEDGWLNFREANDSDFDIYKERVAREAEDDDIFEAEYEDAPEDTSEDTTEDTTEDNNYAEDKPLDDEDITIEEILLGSVSVFDAEIKKKEENDRRHEEIKAQAEKAREEEFFDECDASEFEALFAQ